MDKLGNPHFKIRNIYNKTRHDHPIFRARVRLHVINRVFFFFFFFFFSETSRNIIVFISSFVFSASSSATSHPKHGESFVE